MKCQVTSRNDESIVSIESNCYSDSLPLLNKLIFRRKPINSNTQSFALALAVLLADYCGNHFEVGSLAIGNDYIEAMRLLLGDVNVSPTKPMMRSLANYEHEIACGPARDAVALCRSASRKRNAPLVTVTWSGDFVDRGNRTSEASHIGSIFTNADLITDKTQVSIALALMMGEDMAGHIHVPHPGGKLTAQHNRIVDALATVAIGVTFI